MTDRKRRTIEIENLNEQIRDNKDIEIRNELKSELFYKLTEFNELYKEEILNEIMEYGMSLERLKNVLSRINNEIEDVEAALEEYTHQLEILEQQRDDTECEINEAYAEETGKVL